jgi:hypothetical protein
MTPAKNTGGWVTRLAAVVGALKAADSIPTSAR